MDRADRGIDSEAKSGGMKKNSVVLPGDELAISEEYLPGKYAYDDSGRIRALLAGRVVEDMVNREISVKPAAVARTLAVGDYVTGQVEAVQSNSAGVRIYYHNGKPTEKGFSGMLLLRREPPGRGARTRTYVKLGDIVRARVSSTLNAIIQLSIDDPRSGVIFALCGKCGRPLLGAGNRAKCEECGNVEERKFANDFGQSPIQP